MITQSPGDSGVPLSRDADLRAVSSSDLSKASAEDGQQHERTAMRSDSISSSSLSLSQEVVLPEDGSGSLAGDVDEHEGGLLGLSVEANGDLQRPVKTRSGSRASSSASRVRGTSTPGGSIMPQAIKSSLDAVVLPELSVESTEDQHHLVTTRRRSRSSSLSASHSQNTGSSGCNKVPQSHSPGNDVKMQFEQSEPLPSLPALEVIRTSEGGIGSVHHSPGYHWAHQISGLDRRSESPGSGKSDDGSRRDRRSYASSSHSSSPSWHSAWDRIGFSDHYRHIFTGQVFKDHGNAPQKPGPSADDIPEGWKAKLASKDDETWEYVHRATGIVIDVPPNSLSEPVKKEFDLAASYGRVPKHCQGQLKDGHIMYKSVNPSALCPTGWRTAKHPKIIEDEMKEYLANIKAHPTRPAQVMLLTQNGQRLPVDLETRDYSQMSGMLVITDIDQPLISQLCANQEQMPLIAFFIACHFLLRALHEDEATKMLAREIQGWFWMSQRNEIAWEGRHHDAMYDDKLSLLHFGFDQYPDIYFTPQHELYITRLSTFDVSRKLTIVLIGDMKPDCDRLMNDDIEEFAQPAWWLPAVPAYLGADQMDVRKYLLRLLQAISHDVAAIRLPRVRKFDPDSDLEDCHELFIPYRLVMSTWQGGVQFLMRETDYFWEQAINGPHVDDFTRLKASKRYAATLYQDMSAWMAKMEGLLSPEIDRGGARAMNELRDVLGQILAFKQEIGDTFQLLIGAIAIKDSEIQKKLAQESKLQARRSTALTALAAIYLPLSLTTGVFGMNVVEIEEGKPRYWAALAVAIGLLIATLPFLVWVYLDKDDQGNKRVRSTMSGRHSADSQGHHSEKTDGTSIKSHSQDLDAEPLDLVRRRTTRYSQMSWGVTGGSRPDSPRKSAHPENMV